MKKICIVTICDKRNLGNRLQNYAVQEIVRRVVEGAEIETLRNTNRSGRGESLHSLLKDGLRDIKYHKRTRNFKKFNRHIVFSKRSFDSSNDNTTLSNKYDLFVAGSDQVWNPFFGWLNSIDLLSFARPDQRIAFSASFGIDDIPDIYKEEVSKQLLLFKAISVREDQGKKIVEDLTGRKDVEVLIDPTLLINKDEWASLAKKPAFIKGEEPFILKYFLGDVSSRSQESIKEIAVKKNYKVIDIFDKKSDAYSCGPSEFLWLEKHAELICTDSYHSSIFAIINERPFILFEREGGKAKMGSRLSTLLSTFHLERCRFGGRAITEDNLIVDYSKTKKILALEQKKALDFLKKALK